MILIRAFLTIAVSVLLSSLFFTIPSTIAASVKSLRNKSNNRSSVPVIPKLRTDTVTLSGFDGGASFATQYHIAHSSQFKGAALLSTIPYLCAEGTLAGATNCLTDPILINLEALYAEAASLSITGTVDPFSNLASQYVVIGASPQDTLVNIGGSKAASSMYQSYLGAGTVDTDFSLGGANHAWITSKYGNTCGMLGAPYISNCPQSFAESSMQKLFNHMGIAPLPASPTFNSSHLYLMDQTKFGANPVENALARHGYVYVPPQCHTAGAKAGQCHFHMHFHGCNQSSAVMVDGYVLSTQLNEFALANDVVVYYPQAAPNVEFLNNLGCFDFYGYEIDLMYPLAYATKDGGQMKIIQFIHQAFLSGFE